jgi:hypothetical protein
MTTPRVLKDPEIWTGIGCGFHPVECMVMKRPGVGSGDWTKTSDFDLLNSKPKIMLNAEIMLALCCSLEREELSDV